MNFIDLHAHSTYSLLDGFGTPKEIVARAVELGWDAAAITEHGWLGSAPAFYKACKEAGIKPILGCELYVTPDHQLGMKGKEFQKASFHLTALALSREGYQNLLTWTTIAMQRENYYHKPRISIAEMVESARWPLHHNVILSGCMGGELAQALLSMNGNSVDLATLYVQAMRAVFPNFYIEVQAHYKKRFIDEAFPAYVEMTEREEEVRPKLLALAEATGTPYVLTNDSHYQHPSQRTAHVAMKASAWRSRDDLYGSKERLITGYAKDYIYYTSYLRDMEGVAERAGISDSALESVAEIVQEANIVLDPLDNFSYSIPHSGYENPVERIRRRARSRLAKLEKKHGNLALERFEHELASMGTFAHYLLLLSDFIIAARKQGILTWTRGSAANSLLCYCLKIHDIDSIEFGLTFSRFFNPARKKLPDIDVDIDPDRYDDFMRIVHEKMEPLVGEGQVVQICNLGTAANRSAFRMAASALGIPKEEQDEISKLLPQMIDSGVVDEGVDVFTALKEEYPEIYELTSAIFDSVKNVSQHACAWVFGTPERPVADWIPLYLIASSGTLVTQYDFKAIEDFGLVKGDFLRLKSLTVVSEVLRSVGKSPLDFHKIPLDDPDTYEMIRAGKVEGVHTIQGKEVRRGVVEMQAENVNDLILAAALYRPANTREGKDKLYVERRRGAEVVEYPHEIVEEILGSTHGVPVFQEQAMEIGYAVGMDDEGVDDIYQAIKKAKGQGRGAKEAFAKIKPKFLKAARKVMSDGQAEATWEFVQAFQGYGFNKGHATSYGILAAKSAFLRNRYSAQFHAAILRVFPGKATYLASARSEGFQLLAPSINESKAGFSHDALGGGIRVGLGQIDKLGPVAVNEILAGAPFHSLDDFKERTKRRAVNSARMENLARVGALECIGIRGERSDEAQFELLGFTLKAPVAFRGCKPNHVSRRNSDSGWVHDGLERGVEISGTKHSASKLFWIPPKGNKLELKASPWAQTKTWLMTVLDENGIPFHIMAPEDRKDLTMLMKFLFKMCKGRVVCLDGMIRLPFVMGGAQGFRLFGITGAYNKDPQIFPPKKNALKYIEAAKSLRYAGEER